MNNNIDNTQDSQLDIPLNTDGDEITPNDITTDELALLDSTDENSGEGDDELLNEAELDSTDEDGEPLNENDDLSGKDLDVPGAGDDDANEDIGDEDEENNDYSGADEENE